MATKIAKEFTIASKEFKIRDALIEDCDAIYKLMKQLAEYENLLEISKLTPNDLRRDGFETTNPLFYCKVAEIEPKRVVGFAMYCFQYSSFWGKIIYLEDFYVEPEFRGKGIGSALFKSVAQETIKTGSANMTFSVFAWNEPSIKFYRNRGCQNVSETEQWRTFRLEGNELVKLAKDDKPTK